MSQTTLKELKAASSAPATRVGFDTVNGFEAMQRMAKLFTASSIVPDAFRGNNLTNQGNAVIALDMALRMGANPLMVMQNLYVVHGRPAWSAQFLIATLNQSGKFSSLRYEFQGKESQDDWGCRAVATELSTAEKLSGPLITIGLAKKEGWYNKNGSKWQTMPELMLRYRAASWFVRAYAPEIAMGLQTAEEVADTFDLEASPSGVYTLDDIAAKPDETDQADTGRDSSAPQPAASAAEAAPAGKQPAQSRAEATPQPEQVEASRGYLADTDSSYLIPCPRKSGNMVDERDCAGKVCREGCPEFD